MKRKLLLAALALIGVTSASANVTLNTDLTKQFEKLTEVNEWSGAQGYTATNFCPMVEVGGGIGQKQVIERFVWNCDETGDILTATVSGLTAGTYTIELYGAAAFTGYRDGFSGDAWSTGSWEAGQSIQPTTPGSTGVYLYAQTAELYEKEIPIYYATNFPDGASTVTLENIEVGSDGQIKIGMKKESKSTNWHVVQLKSVIATVDGDALLNARRETAAGLLNSPMNADIKAALQSAYDATPEENENAYQEAIDELEAAIADAQVSIAVYATVKAQLDIADELDENGKAAYTSSDAYIQVSEAYEKGSLEEFTNEQELAVALREAAKQQTTIGSNMTWAIEDWDFIYDTGWIIETPKGGATGHPADQPSQKEYWAGNASSRSEASFDYYQTLTGLPVGKYTITASMWYSTNGETAADNGGVTPVVDATAGVYAKSGDEEAFKGVDIDSDNSDLHEYSIVVDVYDGTLRLGVKNNGRLGARWFGVDWIKLTLEDYITVPVEFSNEAGYATFSSEYALDLSGVEGGKAYIVTAEASEETIAIAECTETVPAKTGLIVIKDGDDDVTIRVASNAEELKETNYLVATDGENPVPEGSYVLASKKDGSDVGFYVLNQDDKVLEAGKAYLDAKAVSAANPAKVLRIVFGDETATAIEAVATEAEADGVLYNVAGQQVGKDYKGIVIKNGKKYLNK